MSRDLIDRSELPTVRIEIPKKLDDETCRIIEGLVKAFKAVIDSAPAVDAEPVKHGIWEEDPYVWRCSECQKWVMVEQGDADMNFCTHCGARMDGRVE